MENDALDKADQVAAEKAEALETALEIAKDAATTPEEADERDKLLEEIRKLNSELDETKGERDRFKRERDEANTTLRSIDTDKVKEKLEFDEIFNKGE